MKLYMCNNCDTELKVCRCDTCNGEAQYVGKVALGEQEKKERRWGLIFMTICISILVFVMYYGHYSNRSRTFNFRSDSPMFNKGIKKIKLIDTIFTFGNYTYKRVVYNINDNEKILVWGR